MCEKCMPVLLIRNFLNNITEKWVIFLISFFDKIYTTHIIKKNWNVIFFYFLFTSSLLVNFPIILMLFVIVFVVVIVLGANIYTIPLLRSFIIIATLTFSCLFSFVLALLLLVQFIYFSLVLLFVVLVSLFCCFVLL